MALVRLVLRRGALVLVLALTLGCGVAERAAEVEEAASEPAPAFELASLDGSQVSLASLEGRPVVIDFWATWCVPCIRQIPVLNELRKQHGDRVSVVGIAVDAQGLEVVAPFAEEHGMEYTILIGDEALAQDFGAKGFPTLFILNAQGAIEEAHVGVVSLGELEEALERAGA